MRPNKRRGRASVQTGRASSAMILFKWIVLCKLNAGEQCGQKKVTPCASIEKQGVFAYPSDTGQAREVSVPLADGATIAWLYRHGEVRSRRDEGETAWLTVALDEAAAAQFERRQAR